MVRKALLLCAAALLIGCANGSDPKTSDTTDDANGSVQVTLPGARTARAVSGVATVADISEYSLELKNSGSGYSSVKEGLPDETITFAGIPTGSGYSLAVTAFNSTGKVIFTGLTEGITVNSLAISEVTITLKPDTGSIDVSIVVPDGFTQALSASDGLDANTIAVEWLPLSGATEYRVFRSATIGGTYSQIGTTTNAYYNDQYSSTLKQGIVYYYKVVAVTPTKTVEGPIDSGYLKIYPLWSLVGELGTYADKTYFTYQSTNYETYFHYVLYRAEAIDGTYAFLREDLSYGGGFVDSTVTPGKRYYYKVRVKSGSFDIYSDYAGPVECYASLPYIVCAASSNATRVQISWTGIANAEKYLIQRSTSIAENLMYTTIAEVPNTGALVYNDTSGLVNTTYWYRVIGVSSQGIKSLWHFNGSVSGLRG
jgi:hypothetical protein